MANAPASRSTLMSTVRGFVPFGATGREPNMFDAFGPAARRRAQVTSRPVALPLFSIVEAKRRIRGIFDSLTPTSTLEALQEALAATNMRLEARIYGKNKPITFLADAETNKRVLAASVDRRLSFRAMQERFNFGRTPEEMMTREQKIAASFRLQMVREVLPAGKTLYADWDDLYFMLPMMTSGASYAERGGIGYVGKVVGKCPDTPEELEKYIAAANAVGKKLIVPSNPVSGAPILDATFATRAELIHPSLSAQELKAAHGMNAGEYFEKMAAANRPKSVLPFDIGATVADAGDFELRFPSLTPKPAIEPTPENVMISHGLDAFGGERIVVIDRETRKELSVKVSDLPVGEYKKDDEYGLENGAIVVAADKTIYHYSASNQLHNEFGPAIATGENSERDKVYALNNMRMNKDEFTKTVARMNEQSNEVASQTPEAASTTRDAEVEDEVPANNYLLMLKPSPRLHS